MYYNCQSVAKVIVLSRMHDYSAACDFGFYSYAFLLWCTCLNIERMFRAARCKYVSSAHVCLKLKSRSHLFFHFQSFRHLTTVE